MVPSQPGNQGKPGKRLSLFQSGKSLGIWEKFLKSGKNQGNLFGQTFPTCLEKSIQLKQQIISSAWLW
ncbi:hypothetical protein DPMN_091965 [Dreissena polymorpha]|uniref:Uncharacterized protein n=1 Tax=Dreissena polymorpha TaxID=45954 RepID=A0A9D4L0G4_DREPO|nr:hypothetical protein DPMN_091965 [Dreissena polymorpha]